MNIVICDDEKYIVDKVFQIVDDYLYETGLDYDIYTYASGDEAIESGVSFDIAFLDIEMNGLDGLRTAKRLYRRNPNLIVLIITSFSDYIDDALELSVYRYIDKPIDKRRLKNCFMRDTSVRLNASSSDTSTIHTPCNSSLASLPSKLRILSLNQPRLILSSRVLLPMP